MTTRSDYVLAELRCALLRAKLWQADIESIGKALAGGSAQNKPSRRSPIAIACNWLSRRGRRHEPTAPQARWCL